MNDKKELMGRVFVVSECLSLFPRLSLTWRVTLIVFILQYANNNERNALLEKNRTFLEQENEERLGELNSKMNSLRDVFVNNR